MAITIIPAPDNGLTTRRYIERAVVKDIINKTGFISDAQLVFEEVEGQVRNQNSEDTPSEHPLRFANENLVFVAPEEVYDEDLLLERLRSSSVDTPLIEDNALGLRVVPIYAPVHGVLGLSFRAKSKTMIRSWARQLAIQEKLAPLIFDHSLIYNYTVPKTLDDFITHIHELREVQDGYGDTLEDYATAITKAEITLRSNRSGEYTRLSFNEQQHGVRGQFSSTFSYNEKSLAEGLYEIPVEFIFDYEKIVAFAVEAPIIVHNQILAPEFLNGLFGYDDSEKTEDKEMVGRIHGTPRGVYAHRFDDGIKRMLPQDTWFPQYTLPELKTLSIIAIKVDIDTPRYVIDLSELDEEYMPPHVLNFILNYPDTAYEFHTGPYYIELVSVGTEEQRRTYNIDPQGVMTTNVDLNPRHRHYLRICALTDHMKIYNEALDAYRTDANAVVDSLKEVHPEVEVSQAKEPGKLHAPDGQTVTLESISEVLKDIPTTNRPFKEMNAYPAGHVMDAVIKAL